MTQQYERSKVVGTPTDEVFAWMAEIENLPKYLPPIKEVERADGSGDRVWMKGEIPDRGESRGRGLLPCLRGGSPHGVGSRGWPGLLRPFAEADLQDGKSRVSVQLYFGERSVEGEIQEASGEGRDPLVERIDATLVSIRRQIEEGSGKVERLPTTG